MNLSSDLSGNEVVKLLARHYGYRVTLTRGGHMIVILTVDTNWDSVVVPRDMWIGTPPVRLLLHEKRKMTELLTKKDDIQGFPICEIGLGGRVRRPGFKRRHYRELGLVLLDVISTDV